MRRGARAAVSANLGPPVNAYRMMKNFNIAPSPPLTHDEHSPASPALPGADLDVDRTATVAGEDDPAVHDAEQIGANHAEIKDWLRLCHTPGVSGAAVRRLLAAFGPPDVIFRTSAARLGNVLPPELVARLLARPSPELDDQIARTLDWASRSGCAVVTLSECAYPRALLALGDAPPILYCRGDASLPNRALTAAAIVGSRRATPQGRENARHFARALGDAGVTVVSGLAAGIDAAAHEGAVETAGSTCAVVGTGVDVIYPSRHDALAQRIAERGLLLSAFPIGTPPRPDHFPRRNRLIAALSRCTVVVEAATQSGSLITARLAGELGRDVLAVPGSIHAPQSRGCHTLIRDGATLVASPDDVLEALGIDRPTVSVASTAPAGARRRATTDRQRAHSGRRDAARSAPATHVEPAGNAPGLSRVHAGMATPGAAAVLEALGYDPVSADTLCERTGMPVTAVLAQLGLLELGGRIVRLPGGQFARLDGPEA
ncbi:DNA protecting protein DprA [Pandoraea pulmonicola]|uniref:DNA protecting protein DprA n=3 Tax=Pandoraea pulmonicola TaxID=93221 RepID=A0AAJ4ZCS6_PANPU|nr:DNA protecting protein DprA [Pandoraea pulmonicola]